MDLHATLDALEHHIEQLAQSLQQAHDELDEAATTPPAHDDLQAVSEASEHLQHLSSQLADACGQWHSETAHLHEQLTETLSALTQILADHESQADAEANGATHDFEAARSDIDHAATQTLDEAQRALSAAQDALQAMLGDVHSDLSSLMEAAHARFVDAAAGEVGEAIAALTHALEQLESAGGDVARTAMGGVKTITDGLEGIMDVLNAVKPAFDVIALIA